MAHGTFTIKELAQRYGCSKSTIFHAMNEKGFPRGGRGISRSTSISAEEVYKWERRHMPWLHAADDDTSWLDADRESWCLLNGRTPESPALKVAFDFPAFRADLASRGINPGVLVKMFKSHLDQRLTKQAVHAWFSVEQIPLERLLSILVIVRLETRVMLNVWKYVRVS